jgi:flagellar biosynthesis protein FliQ
MRATRKGDGMHLISIAVLAAMIVGIIVTLAPHAKTTVNEITGEASIDIMGTDD